MHKIKSKNKGQLWSIATDMNGYQYLTKTLR